MAISTDATVQDFSELVSKPRVEMRSSTSGSEARTNNSLDTVSQQTHLESERTLETAIPSMAEIPFQVTKEGSRRIAELTSDEDYNLLISQRRELVHKQLENSLSRDEFLRLRLIEWTLDCVEKSREGLNLNSLQQIAKTHEIIAARVSRTAEQLEAVIEAENAKHRYRRTA